MLPLTHLAILAALALIVTARLTGGSRMSTNAIQAKLQAGATVLDVRTREEYAQGAYPGALHIPVQELPQRMAEVPKDKPLVVYCAAGARAANAVKILQAAGFPDVVNAGGLADMPR
jgi:rhodanese-related sulfurtransferase